MTVSSPIVKLLRESSSGVALVELVIATAALTVVLIGIITAINFSVNTANYVSNKTISVQLANEAIESARGLQQQGWTATNQLFSLHNPSGETITINGTNYTRRITFVREGAVSTCNPNVNDIVCNFTVVVEWGQGPRLNQTIVTTKFSNWRD